MTVRTRAELNSDADTNLADNTSGDIGAADVRTSVKNLADSAVLPGDAPYLTGVELGAATDTTISRGAAGFIAVEGNRVPSPAAQASGDLLYRGATEWERLAKGTAAQVLTMNAGATAPEWAAPSAAGWDTSSQTWQSVTRTAGTSYQNSTAQPIQISARVSCAGSTVEFAFEVSPNNSTWTTIMQFTGSGASGVVYAVVACVIPPNLYYRRRNVAGTPSWSNAVELR